jgi:hypothetical protein
MSQAHSSRDTLVDAVASLVDATTENARATAENACLLRELAQSNQQNNNTYAAFLKTDPPTFNRVDDPLEADH